KTQVTSSLKSSFSITMRLLFCCFFLFSIIVLKAQNVLLIDSETNEPISNVAVFNDDKEIYAVSDEMGSVDISAFEGNELITFQHVAFYIRKLTKAQINKLKNTISLEPNSE